MRGQGVIAHVQNATYAFLLLVSISVSFVA